MSWQVVGTVGGIALGVIGVVLGAKRSKGVRTVSTGAIFPPEVGNTVIPGVAGKGLYVRGSGPLDAATAKHPAGAQAMIERCQWLGVRWLAFQTIMQERSKDRVVTWWHPYVAALRDAGISCWSWGYPRPRATRRAVRANVRGLDSLGLAGHIANPEEPWQGEAKAAQELAAALADIGRLAVVSFPLATTGYIADSRGRSGSPAPTGGSRRSTRRNKGGERLGATVRAKLGGSDRRPGRPAAVGHRSSEPQLHARSRRAHPAPGRRRGMVDRGFPSRLTGAHAARARRGDHGGGRMNDEAPAGDRRGRRRRTTD